MSTQVLTQGKRPTARRAAPVWTGQPAEQRLTGPEPMSGPGSLQRAAPDWTRVHVRTWQPAGQRLSGPLGPKNAKCGLGVQRMRPANTRNRAYRQRHRLRGHLQLKLRVSSGLADACECMCAHVRRSTCVCKFEWVKVCGCARACVCVSMCAFFWCRPAQPQVILLVLIM